MTATLETDDLALVPGEVIRDEVVPARAPWSPVRAITFPRPSARAAT